MISLPPLWEEASGLRLFLPVCAFRSMAPAFFLSLLLFALEIQPGLQLLLLSGSLLPGLFALLPLEGQSLLSFGSRAALRQLAADSPLTPFEAADQLGPTAGFGRRAEAQAVVLPQQGFIDLAVLWFAAKDHFTGFRQAVLSALQYAYPERVLKIDGQLRVNRFHCNASFWALLPRQKAFGEGTTKEAGY